MTEMWPSLASNKGDLCEYLGIGLNLAKKTIETDWLKVISYLKMKCRKIYILKKGK